MDRRRVIGAAHLGDGLAVAQHPRYPRQRLQMIRAGPFGRQKQEDEVDRLVVQRLEVDLVFLLLAPEGAGADHLKALSRIARVLRDGETVAKVRGTNDAAAIHALLSDTQGSKAA